MLYIENRSGDNVNEAALQALCAVILSCEDASPESEVNLVLCGSDEIRILNRRFRGLDKATDVLSFPCEVEETEELGDIMIDTQTASRQKGAGSLDDEVQLLFTHGVLHLLGYDHQSRAQREEMEARQQLCLQAFRSDNNP